MNKKIAFVLLATMLFCSSAFAAVPIINSFSIASNAAYTNNETPTLSIDASDANGMSFSCDNSNFTAQVAYATSYSDFNFNDNNYGCATGDGNKFIYLKAHSSDSQEAGVNDSIILDTAKPVLVADANSGWQATDANIEIACTDSLSGCNNLKINGSDYSFTDQGKYYHVVSNDGNNAAAIQVFDNAGNSEQKTVYAAIDKTGPTTTSNVAGGWHNSDQNFGLVCTDSGSGCQSTQYRINLGAWTAYTGAGISLTAAADANFQIDFNSMDNSGYGETMKIVTILFDLNTPEISSFSVTVGSSWTNDSTPTFETTAADENSGLSHMRFSCNNSDWSTETGFATSYSGFNITNGATSCNTSSGTKTIYVQAKDNAGNWSASSSIAVNYDITAPTAPPAPSVAIGDEEVTLSWGTVSDSGGSGIKDYKAYLNGSYHSRTTGNSISITGLSNGTSYNFKIGAVDNADNEAIGPESSGTPVDSGNNNNNNNTQDDYIRPIVTWKNPSDNATVGGVVTLEIEATDIGAGIGFVRFILPDNNYVYGEIIEGTNRYSAKWFVWDLNGSHEISVFAQDKASPSNNKSISRSRTFKIDNTANFGDRDKDAAEDAIDSAENSKQDLEDFLDEINAMGIELENGTLDTKQEADELLRTAKTEFARGDYLSAKSKAESALEKYNSLAFSVSVGSHGTTQKYLFSEDKVPIFLKAAGFGQEAIDECIALMQDIVVERTFEIKEIKDGNKTYYKAVITIVLENNSTEDKELKVIEIIPKEFAENAEQLTSSADMVVLEADPKIEFSVMVAAGQTKTISYSLKESLTSTLADKMLEEKPLDFFISTPVILGNGTQTIGTGESGTAAFAPLGFLQDPLGIGLAVILIVVIVAAGFFFARNRGKEEQDTSWGTKESNGLFEKVKGIIPKGEDKGQPSKWRYKGN